MSLRAPTMILLALGATGCRGCHDDHPYVPYTIGSAETSTPPVAADLDAAQPAPSDAGGFEAESALSAPPGIARWPLVGAVLDAPGGMLFVAAVVRDFDGDSAPDAFAIARPPGGNDPGVLAFYHGPVRGEGLAPSAIIAPPTSLALARDASCTPVDRLELVGPHAALVELGAACPLHSSPAPDRWMAIVAAGAGASVRLAATITDPRGAPALTVEANTTDRDEDGLPDVELRVTLDGGGAPLEPGPRVSASFAWLDRPAGLSRDLSATDESFKTLASAAESRARSDEASSVPAFVGQVRALWRAVCADAGSPRFLGVVGTGAVTCGAGPELESVGLAEVRAFVTMGDPLRAALALDAAQRPPAAHTVARTAEARGWIETLAPSVRARAVRSVLAVPLIARGHEPSWGPLAFEPSGKLLVRTRAGVVRVDPDQGDEAAADGVAAWSSAVTSPDHALHWIEAYDPCDGPSLRASFATGDDIRDVALPVAPPLGDRCAGSRGAPAPVLPIAWGPAGLEAIVDQQPLIVTADLAHVVPLAGLLDQPGAPGSPLSPDGRTLVVPTSAGFVVRSPSRTRLLRSRGLDGSYLEQRGCTVSNDGDYVACVHAGRVWVGAWD